MSECRVEVLQDVILTCIDKKKFTLISKASLAGTLTA